MLKNCPTYIFKYSSGNWEQVGEILLADDSWYGGISRVSISNDGSIVSFTNPLGVYSYYNSDILELVNHSINQGVESVKFEVVKYFHSRPMRGLPPLPPRVHVCPAKRPFPESLSLFCFAFDEETPRLKAPQAWPLS